MRKIYAANTFSPGASAGTRASMTSRVNLAAALLLCCAAAQAGEISYSRDIQPILSRNCYACHGADDEARKAGLRLDQRASALETRDGVTAIVPGAPDQSELLRRITTADPEDRMPPPDAGDALAPAQVAALTQWIQEGAEWSGHWAFAAPVKPAVPAVRRAEWVRNPIDAFVLARLEAEGIAPSPPAPATDLVRRAALDITGLPPTPEAVDAFLLDNGPAAWTRLIDGLLDSPHYGERWARHWLDAAQYADSDGFEKDKPRYVWAWRDWVIHALNEDLPYNQFILEQIAGDLLPNATQSQRVATGFLRNSLQNEEGGIDPEQFRMEALFTRMDILGRAVLGLTIQCAQCHSHKYDPLTQADYYRMLAFLNSSYEGGVTVYSQEQQKQREAVLAEVARREAELKADHPDWRERLRAWEVQVRAMPQPEWQPLDFAFDDSTAGGQKFTPQGDGSYLAQGYAPTKFTPKMTAKIPLPEITAIKLELLTDPNLLHGGPGRSKYGACALSEFDVYAAPAGAPVENLGEWKRLEIASAIADVNPPRAPLNLADFPQSDERERITGPIKFAIDGNGDTAWTTDNGPGRRNEDRFAVFTLAQPFAVDGDMEIMVLPAQNHGGHNSNDFQTNNLGRFRVSVTGAAELPEAAVPGRIREIVDTPEDKRTNAQWDALFRHWRTTQPDLFPANFALDRVWKNHPEGTSQLVLQERDTPRITRRLERGDFLKPAEEVQPAVPQFLHPMPENAPRNRLGFARWLISEESPTTARAIVNRVWQQYFGQGLVTTPDDFGIQGAYPSHPELLDWLAADFMENGWSLKYLHRLITGSATYRQDARIRPELQERDPLNALLARQQRIRVEGEIVRDIALAASGLLNPKIGGPGVYPPAPPFIFVAPASYGDKTWLPELPDQAYRRGIYTYRFRTVPFPVLQAFDAPSGEAPCVRRDRSNTPMQALTTLNEPVFLECARALAARALEQGGTGDAERLAFAFRRCVGRMPSAAELDLLLLYLEEQRGRIRRGELDAGLLAAVDTSAVASAEAGELAAWTLAARVMLNLDETIVRP